MKAKCMQSHRSQRKKTSREDRYEPEGHRLQRTKEEKGCHPTGGVTPGHGDLGWASQWSGKMNREQKDGPLVLIPALPLRCASLIPGSGQSCWKRTQLWPPMILNTWTPVFFMYISNHSNNDSIPELANYWAMGTGTGAFLQVCQ